MAADDPNLDDRIAEQIRELAEKSAELELALVDYIADDLDEIRAYAKQQGIPPAEVALLVLKGIEKGLLQYGKVEWELIVELLKKVKNELRKHLPF